MNEYKMPLNKRTVIKWVLFVLSLVFGQLANYTNPDPALWMKFGITAASFCVAGVILAAGGD